MYLLFFQSSAGPISLSFREANAYLEFVRRLFLASALIKVFPALSTTILSLSLPTVLLSTVLRNFKFSFGREGVPRYLWATRLWGVSRIGNNCRTNAKVYEKTYYGSERVNWILVCGTPRRCEMCYWISIECVVWLESSKGLILQGLQSIYKFKRDFENFICLLFFHELHRWAFQ